LQPFAQTFAEQGLELLRQRSRIDVQDQLTEVLAVTKSKRIVY
jgi:hypothetical protein